MARASGRRKEIIAKWQQRTLWDDGTILDYGRVYTTHRGPNICTAGQSL